MTVLVVDDEPEIRQMLGEALEEEGYAVVAAANGKDALAYLKSAAPLPSLILLDIMMPVMNGAQCWRALKSNPVWATIPVILLSGGIYLQQAAHALPAVAIIPKPLNLLRLLSLARAYCTPLHARSIGEEGAEEQGG